MGCEPETGVAGIPLHSSPASPESSFRELDDAFLQTQTKIWLGEVLQIRLDEQLSISELLADGELLFQVSIVMWKLLLAKHMELRHIKAYKSQPFSSKKNSGRYRPYSNVDSFLKICKILGLTGIDLFSPSDVVEKRNTRKVCTCVRSFSKKARFKNIRFPDFDIVTYTVVVPKDMVGCICRNLELSQSSLADSHSYFLQKHAGGKFRQGYSVTASNRNYETYSEESDDTEIGHPVHQSDDVHTGFLYHYTSKINSNLEDLDQLNIQSQQRNETSGDESESLCSMESLQYVCSENMDQDCKLNWSSSLSCFSSHIDFSGMASDLDTKVKRAQESSIMDSNYSEHDSLGNSSSVIGNPMNEKTPATRVALERVTASNLIANAKDSRNPDLFYEENSTSIVHQSASSHGSNSTPGTTENGMRSFEIGDNIEVLRVAGMGCWSGEALNLGDQFDEENNIQSSELHNDKADIWNKIISGHESQDTIIYKEMAYGTSTTLIARDSQSVKEFGDTEYSLYSPDRYLCKTTYSDRLVSYSNDVSLTEMRLFLARENRKSQIFLKGLDDAGCDQSEVLLSCHQSYSLPESCKWDQKGKCAMTSNKVKDHKSYSSFFSEVGSQEETTPCIQHKDSGVLSSKAILSCVPYDEEEVVSAALVKLDSDTDGKQLSTHCQAISSNVVDVEYREKCPTIGDDANEFHNEGKRVLDMITDDAPFSYHNVVVPANCDGDVSKGSKLECNAGHQACQYDMVPVERTSEAHCQEGLKPEEKGMVSNDNSVEKEEGIEITKGKPQKKLLLKSVLGGTAAFGLLFMILHLRKNDGEKAAQSSTSKASSPTGPGEENVQKYSPKNARRSTTRGVYPSEKLTS